MKRVSTWLGLALLSSTFVGGQEPLPQRPMSIQDRLVLNRAALREQERAEVLLATDPTVLPRLVSASEKAGGTVRYVDRVVGYLRVELPIEALPRMLLDRQIDAYQLGTRAQWENDARNFKAAPNALAYGRTPFVPPVPSRSGATLPLLTKDAAERTGYSADEGTGVDQWLRDHPTYDGRGVTIAVIEDGQLDYSSPIFASAKSLDGREVRKVPDILNTTHPDEYDVTRIAMTTQVDAKSTWVNIGARPYVLPRPGKYLFGQLSLNAPDNLLQQYGVVRNIASGEVWVDGDDDGDFRNDPAMRGLKERFEVGFLKVTYPYKARVSYVVTAGTDPADVHVYPARNRHNMMTASVAAGSRSRDGLAYGVAPAARLLPVDVATRYARAVDVIEGYLAAAARPDVDVLSTSLSLAPVADTDKDLIGVVLRRIVEKYNKPIFMSAGNAGSHVSGEGPPSGGAFLVGASISPAAWATFHGGSGLKEVQINPITSAGPGMDGSLKPDFLAPLMRIAATVCPAPDVFVGEGVPAVKPTTRLPPCNIVSGGTSTSAPYAAGLAALLISAAKQAGVDYSLPNLARALRASATFLPNTPAHEQGTGLLSIDSAWRELQRGVAPIRISVRGESPHVLLPYTNSEAAGVGGLFEKDWTIGSPGSRAISLSRESGPPTPLRYRVSWTGNDGTFSTADSVVLPLRTAVKLLIAIEPRTAAAHSAILNLHELASDAIVLRTLATVIVPEPLRPSSSYVARFEGRLPYVRTTNHFWQVPAGVAALSLELTVKRGVVRTELVANHGLSLRTLPKYPISFGRPLPVGTYRFLLADPGPGTWNLSVANDREDSAHNDEQASGEAEYTFTVRALDASLTTAASNKRDTLLIANHGSALAEPAVKESWGRLVSQQEPLRLDGFANRFEVQVPPDSSALTMSAELQATAKKSGQSQGGVDLYLYDCTSGECLWYDFAVSSSDTQRLTVRKPRAGKWVAMVNGAPTFPATGNVTMKALIVSDQQQGTVVPLGSALRSGEKRQLQTTSEQRAAPFEGAVRVFELFDCAIEQHEREQAWWLTATTDKDPTPYRLDDLTTSRPVALGVAVKESTAAKKGPGQR